VPTCKLVGIEFTDSAIEKLKQDRRIEAIRADITQDNFLPNGRESFDYVICSEVLEHLEDPAKLVKEIFRLLVRGGMAIITAPYRDRVPSLEHIWEFDIADIKNMMDGCFSQCWVYPWASGSSVYEVADGCGRILYPPGELNVIWGIGVK